MSIRDIRSKTRIALGEAQANHHQYFQTLSTIVAKAFGAEDKDEKAKQNEPKSAEEAQAMLDRLFRKN